MTRTILVITTSLFCFPCCGQSPQTQVQQKAEHSKCSNIIALSGNVNVKCSELTNEQRRLIEKIPQLLNKLLDNQLDPDAIMAKLNEIEQNQKPSQTVYAPNGIGTNGGTLINPQVNNFGYIQKNLNVDQIAYLTSVLKPFATLKERADLVTCQMGDSNSCTLTYQLVQAFRAAGWNVPGSGYSQALMAPAPEPLLILISKNARLNPGDPITSNRGLPPGAFELAVALRQLNVNVQFSMIEGIPEGEFRIVVGTKP